jgi:hypothetical protein
VRGGTRPAFAALKTEQEEGERAVFEAFAAVCPLAINVASVKSRRPPEPDILCEVQGEGPVAFELGEVINEALERATSERVAARRHFRTVYAALPAEDRARIEARIGGVPALFVGFVSGTPPSRWRRAVQPILATLVARSLAENEEDRLCEGDIPVWRIPVLRTLLTDLEVRRSSNGAPFFGVIEMTEVADATRSLLEKKFSRAYRCDAPIELVAYHVGAPPPSEPDWLAATVDFIRSRWPQSPFRRIWLFDGFARAVLLVHPESLTLDHAL